MDEVSKGGGKLTEMLPEFKTDDPEGTKNSILKKIGKIREELPILLGKKERTYDRVIRPLNDLVQEMQIEFTVLAHLNSVKNSEQIQALYAEVLPEITAFYSDLGQNEELNLVYQEILKNENDTLNVPQKKVLQDAVTQFKLSGIGLPPEIKKEFRRFRFVFPIWAISFLRICWMRLIPSNSFWIVLRMWKEFPNRI